MPWIVLGGLFAAAVVYVVAAVPGNDTARTSTAATLPTPGSHGDGLSDSHDGYLLSPVTLPTGRGRAVPVAFRILGPDGAAATRYEPIQTKPLHMYVVRDDLSVYQHLHPRLAGDTWTTTVAVPDGGVYRLYAEFVPQARAAGGHPTVLGTPFVVTGDTTYVALPAPTPSARVDGFTVHRMERTAPLTAGRPAVLRFQVLDAGGTPVTALEPFLGAFAHVSAFDVQTQSLIHLHPVMPADQAPGGGVLTFHAQFPNPGEQRLFLQFRAAGKVRQVAFTIIVT